MADDSTIDVLKRIDRNISALLAITIDRHLRETDLAKPRPRSMDRMLSDVGLTQGEVAKLLGKTPQAVSQVLASESRSKSKKVQSSSNGGS